jgi:hypothetical protein
MGEWLTAGDHERAHPVVGGQRRDALALFLD